MMFEITIKPVYEDHSNYECQWLITYPDRTSENDIIKTEGKIEQNHINQSSKSLSLIAKELTKIYEDKYKENYILTNLNLEFKSIDNYKNTLSTIDLFKLYGILSTKLNPLSIELKTSKHI